MYFLWPVSHQYDLLESSFMSLVGFFGVGAIDRYLIEL
jgi:hypothetical protein